MSEAILPRPQGLNSREVDVSLLLARRDVAEYKLDAQDMAFETYLSTLPWHQGATGADKPSLIAMMSKIMTGPQSPVRDVPANDGATADEGGHTDGEMAPA